MLRKHRVVVDGLEYLLTARAYRMIQEALAGFQGVPKEKKEVPPAKEVVSAEEKPKKSKRK